MTLFGATNNIQEFRRNYSNCKLSHNENSAYRNRTLREKFPYLELFWSVFFRIWTEYGEVIRIFPYSIQMRENKGRHNSEYGHFLRGGRSKLQYSCILSKYRNILNRSLQKISRTPIYKENLQATAFVHCEWHADTANI